MEEPATPQVIGIDLGGTAIKLGRFDAAGQCIQALTVPTPQPPQPADVVEALVTAIAQLDPEGRAIALGIGTPGPTDADGRIARVAINLGWQDVPLADWLEARLQIPTKLANDANCAGLGEAWLGAGQRFQDLILLTLGTGVGGAVILDGTLFVGRHGTGAELGLISIDRAGVPCNSGNCGSLEQHVSAQAVRRITGEEPATLSDRARAGDQGAIAFWHNYGRDLGAGLANLIYIFTPEAIVLGGGLSASSDLFSLSMWQEIEARVLPSSREGLQILTADLGNRAGMVGAAKLAWQQVMTAASQPSLQPDPPLDPPSTLVSQLQPAPSEPALPEMELAYRRAVELAKFKAGFLARTSHELRSPLNGIMGMHQLILSDLCDSPDEEREFIQQAQQSSRKLLTLLDELIYVSKVDWGTVELQIQPLQLSALLTEVHHLTYLQAQNRSIQVELAPADPDLYVMGDPHGLRQALLYLVDAAIAAMPDGTVQLIHHVNPHQRSLDLWLLDNRPASAWQDAVQALQPAAPVTKAELRAFQPAAALSDSLTLLSTQTLLEHMQGTLDLAFSPHQPDRPCLHCTLLLAHD
ncbi:MAG: ROK family protein [Kaiparowitsia implicata GSE-PSE-MK54-09C]|jgi:glucokinase|nr:ROK family protein [Kaiparowitsia implicata GSE-PSE-MK54-09C]